MKSFEYDLRYIQAGLDSIEEYLLSDEVFWPLSAHPPEGAPEYPRLTLDGLLLSKARLLAYPSYTSSGGAKTADQFGSGSGPIQMESGMGEEGWEMF